MARLRKKRESVAFDPVDVHVGKRVRIGRNSLGISQTMLGNELGLTFQQIQKYERGANRIGASRLYEIAQVLDVPVSFFFDDMPTDIAGHRGKQSEALGLDVLASGEARDILRAYYRIESASVRHNLFQLAKAMAKSGNG